MEEEEEERDEGGGGREGGVEEKMNRVGQLEAGRAGAQRGEFQHRGTQPTAAPRPRAARGYAQSLKSHPNFLAGGDSQASSSSARASPPLDSLTTRRFPSEVAVVASQGAQPPHPPPPSPPTHATSSCSRTGLPQAQPPRSAPPHLPCICEVWRQRESSHLLPNGWDSWCQRGPRRSSG